ncbi:MAG: redoxin domain-containing protein [Deferrisomatales bacterium]
MARSGRSAGALFWVLLIWVGGASPARGSGGPGAAIYPVPELPPRASAGGPAVGSPAPEFTLPSVDHGPVSLRQFRGRKNVLLSFVPAAWTPVCSVQWPQYHDARAVFEAADTVLLGLTVDNLPSLYAWTRHLAKTPAGFWFPVLSDFHPHAEVARAYGVLRTDGTSERALILVDREGVVRHVEVFDINRLPHFSRVEKALEALR